MFCLIELFFALLLYTSLHTFTKVLLSGRHRKRKKIKKKKYTKSYFSRVQTLLSKQFFFLLMTGKGRIVKEVRDWRFVYLFLLFASGMCCLLNLFSSSSRLLCSSR